MSFFYLLCIIQEELTCACNLQFVPLHFHDHFAGSPSHIANIPTPSSGLQCIVQTYTLSFQWVVWFAAAGRPI